MNKNLNEGLVRQGFQESSEQIFAVGAESKGGTPPLLRRNNKNLPEGLEAQADKPIIQVGSGILLVDKAPNTTSFHLVTLLRKLTRIEKIGHAGTLDPFATGVMVMLIGKNYTQRSNEFLNADKEYRAVLQLGITTDTYDLEGKILSQSDHIPTLSDIEQALTSFQGTILQTPPMYSAKKIGGQKLCDLARRGITIDRPPTPVTLQTTLIEYRYPMLELSISCSKGTYIRSLAHDLGLSLTCGAHLFELVRIRSGAFHLGQCLPQHRLTDPSLPWASYLRSL